MDNQNNNCCKNFKGLAGILTIFFIVLTIFFIVNLVNAIKENRYIGKDVESKSTITVSATGDIYVKPDLALTSFSVLTEDKEIDKAMAENVQKMNDIIEFVKGQGVDGKDLKTTSFNIYPRYEYKWVEPELYPYPPGKRVLVGYEVRQQLEVKIRDLNKVGDIIKGATEAGSNQIGNLQFMVDNQDEFKKQARGEAIDEAKIKAKELAKQLGVKLIRIISFSESSYASGFYDYAKSSFPEGIGGRGGPEIEIGEDKISVSVNIIYEID